MISSYALYAMQENAYVVINLSPYFNIEQLTNDDLIYKERNTMARDIEKLSIKNIMDIRDKFLPVIKQLLNRKIYQFDKNAVLRLELSRICNSNF